MFFRFNLINYKKLSPNLIIKRLVNTQKELINHQCLHRIRLNTCKQLFGRSDSKNWYLKCVPKTGIDVNVECVDTKPNDKNCPTILALHGCPGSHLDFTKLIGHFGDNYRVIVPNFPDFSLTINQNCFWHSAQEKAQFVRDVLNVLDVHRIECLVAHSSAIFPSSYLWLKDYDLNKDFDIKSVCLLSTPGPKWFTKKGRLMSSVFVSTARVQSIRNYLRQIWTKELTKKLGLKNKIDNYDDLALLLSTYRFSETPTVDQRLKKLKDMKIPTLSMFSSKDNLFKEEIFYSLFDILDTNYEDFDVYEEYQNRMIQNSTADDWIKVVDIRSGGHYVFSTHSPVVHKYIEQLIQKVKD